MPGLLNLWYEQMPYHKILPLEYNLSTRIFGLPSRLVSFVPFQYGLESWISFDLGHAGETRTGMSAPQRGPITEQLPIHHLVTILRNN
jgi:hypothetical protein